MNPLQQRLVDLSRRQFFGRGAGTLSAALGTSALARVLGAQITGQASTGPAGTGDRRRGVLGGPHHAPKAKRVIYLHMMGGPSQLDLWDPKPELHKRRGEDLRKMPSVYQGQRITGMTSGQASLPLAPSIFEFTKHANQQNGAWVSELYPHTGRLADRIAIVKTVHTDAINHEPG